MKKSKVLLCLVSIAVMMLTACSDSDNPIQPPAQVDYSNRLHMVAALSGEITPSGDSDLFVLTLRDVRPDMLWFSDRPARETGEEFVDEFVNDMWPVLFSEVSPNAVLQFFLADLTVEGLYLALSQPVYDETSGVLTFQIELLNSTLQEDITDAVEFQNAVMTVLNNVSADEPQSTFAQFSQVAMISAQSDRGMLLTLDNIDPEVYWVNNAPGRYSFVGTVTSFLSQWNDQFEDIPPNAVVYGTTDDGQLRGYPLVLSSPKYDEANHRLTYRAISLDPPGKTMPDLNYAVAIIDTGDTVQTRWTVEAKGDGFQLSLNGKPIRLKGVCYSPAPINFSNKDFPAVGDLFWDSFSVGGGNMVWNWYSLWGKGSLGESGYEARNDLDALRKLGVNAIRVYSMISRQGIWDGTIPKPGTGHHFTHQQFLDACYNNGRNSIYVLVDIPMPDASFRADIAPESPNLIPFWEYVLDETTRDMANHPAVLGFNIMNEKDAPPVFPNNGQGPPDTNSDYFFSQSKKYADLVDKNAPDKLVGWAVHDAPAMVYFGAIFPTTGRTYFEMLDKFDFWGVNSYQTENMNSVLGAQPVATGQLPYGALAGTMRKPVILTELGWPATGHNPQGEIDPNGAITESGTTRQKTGNLVADMYPKAYAYNLLLGAFYFEFSDEWWKQTDKSAWNGTTAGPTTFPNKYWDEEGFGLFSVRRAAGRVNTDDPWDANSNAPRLPPDVVTERTEITHALKSFYDSLN